MGMLEVQEACKTSRPMVERCVQKTTNTICSLEDRTLLKSKSNEDENK